MKFIYSQSIKQKGFFSGASMHFQLQTYNFKDFK